MKGVDPVEKKIPFKDWSPRGVKSLEGTDKTNVLHDEESLVCPKGKSMFFFAIRSQKKVEFVAIPAHVIHLVLGPLPLEDS